MFQNWLFRLKAKALLQSDYEYGVQEWHEATFKDICTETRSLNLSPGDAAAFFIEVACHALTQPLTTTSAEFVERKALSLLQAVNRGRASVDNFPRATRLYLLAKGTPLERLDEVDEMTETFMRAMAEGRRNGLVYDADASLGLLLEMAVTRGLVERAKVDDVQSGTLTFYS